MAGGALFLNVISTHHFTLGYPDGTTVLPFVCDFLSLFFGDGYKEYLSLNSYFWDLILPILTFMLLLAFIICVYILVVRAANKSIESGEQSGLESALGKVNDKLFVVLIFFVAIASICYLYVAEVPLNSDANATYYGFKTTMETGKLANWFLENPQNIGLYYIWSILYLFLGEQCIMGYYVLNIIAATFAYIMLYKITKQLFKPEKVRTISLIVMFFSYCPIMRTTWAYSDLLFYVLTLCVVFYTIKLCEKFAVKDLIKLLVFAFLDSVVKYNALIIFIACALIILGKAVQTAVKDKNIKVAKLFALPVCAFLIASMGAGGVMELTRNTMSYETEDIFVHSPQGEFVIYDAPMDYKYRKGDVNMRLTGHYWWSYSDAVTEREVELYGNAPVTPETRKEYNARHQEIINNDFKEMIFDYITNPGSLITNIAAKSLILWNDPTNKMLTEYYMLYNEQSDEYKEAQSEIRKALHTEPPIFVLEYIMGAAKKLTLLFALLYLAINRKKLTLVQVLPALVFIGGVLFQTLFFAGNARYLIPYEFVLVPYAAAGIMMFADMLLVSPHRSSG
ncbi:MAG: hypothetical protein LBL41_05995 [Bifidobacteriaceae bacterium]|nr:hypothetical protein [Bifidobacteriaceae bacterium]